jgi:hypothetical protein
MRNLPRPLLLIAGANGVAMLFFLGAFPFEEGGRAIACLGLVLLHGLLSAGLLLRQNWARGLMLVYSLFQIAALATSAVVAILSLQLKPFTAWTATQLILAAVLVPFLGWCSAWLLRDSNRLLFVRPEEDA